MSGLFYADGYFPVGFCGLYKYDPALYNPHTGLTRPGYRHPSGYELYHIYGSYLDNLSLEQAAKIYWRGRVIAAVSTPHAEPTYGSSPCGAPPLHLIPTARTRWGSYEPSQRVCGQWGHQPIDEPIYADPEIPAGTMGPPNISGPSTATPFAVKAMGVSCDVTVFHYVSDNQIRYGVAFGGYISCLAAFWRWDYESDNWLPCIVSDNISAAFGPRGDEGGIYIRESSFSTPWGDVNTLMSNWTGDENVYYDITIENDETLP